jgi:iduronate 2-sulfatase
LPLILNVLYFIGYWSFDRWEGNWYDYQGLENSFMNSSVMPDKVRQEHEFRDHLFTTRTIDTLKRLVKEPKYFMLNIGFKNPHLALHAPYRYYEMYKNKTESWKLSKKELRYPFLASAGGYKCCAEPAFHYMNDEGASRHKKSVHLGDINQAIPSSMRDELMMGYCAMITYVDTQVGRILDALDELSLWNNITVLLTADHGMHNGEKGLW